MAYQPGILSNYLQGANANQVNEPNAFANYLAGYNVNPYWQQYMKGQPILAQPERPAGILSAPTGGAANPYNMTQATPAPAPQQAAPAQGPVTVSGFIGSDNPAIWSFNSRQSGGRPQGVMLSNGQVMSIDDFRAKAGSLLDGRFNIQKGFDVSKMFEEMK